MRRPGRWIKRGAASCLEGNVAEKAVCQAQSALSRLSKPVQPGSEYLAPMDSSIEPTVNRVDAVISDTGSAIYDRSTSYQDTDSPS